MDNTPEMAFGLGAAGLGGHVAVGLNTTRRGDALLADIRKADCQLLLTDAPPRATCSTGSTSAAYGRRRGRRPSGPAPVAAAAAPPAPHASLGPTRCSC